mgnify:CR=1 FL=1
MKTDPSIYTFLATGPEAFRVLTGGLILEGEYAFRSLTFKSLERRADGLYEPLEPDRPVYLIEFQAQYAAAAWYNLLTKIGLYGEEHPEREVRGLLIVLHARDLPARPSRVGAPESIAARRGMRPAHILSARSNPTPETPAHRATVKNCAIPPAFP